VIVLAAVTLLAGAVVALRSLGRTAVARTATGASEATLRALASFADGDRRAWIAAMGAELDAIADPGIRRRFARGCLRAVVLAPAPAEPSAAATRTVLAAGMAGSVGLAVFGLVHYPELREGRATLVYLSAFAAALAVYGLAGQQVAKLGTARARRWALALAAPALVLSAVAEAGPGVASAGVGLGVVVLPGIAAHRAARADGRRSSGLVAGATCSLLAGILTFVGFAAATYATAGGPPTDAMLAEFHRSAATDYATWAIGDNLGGAVFLLGFVPLAGAACAVLGAQLAPGPNPRAS
jgi:hypothetical protein